MKKNLLLVSLLWVFLCHAAEQQGSSVPAGANHAKQNDAQLVGVLSTDTVTLKPGQEILIEFILTNASDAPLYIWDSKFSEGYRSWLFELKTPSGKLVTLQRERQNLWDKNAPHVVEITRAQPYPLRGWGIAHGVWKNNDRRYLFSLRKLGFQTSEPGTYEVKGVFTQKGGQASYHNRRANLWNGRVESNSLQITVEDSH